MSEQQLAVLKINTALSNKSFFVKITDQGMSVDTIFAEVVSSLNNTGRPLESQQLEQLYRQHQLFNFGKVVQKGDLFKDLEQKVQQVGDQKVMVAELDLVTSHTGGIEYKVEIDPSYICVSKADEVIWQMSTKEYERDDAHEQSLFTLIKDCIDEIVPDDV